MNLIRKISIGRDYKDSAMHYAVNQEVYGGHVICDIIEEQDRYIIYITKENEILPWKSFNKNMGISVEFNLDY
jgi:ABC-type nitrate/sulfonate/bicarbonate transport system ATPase subunit